MNVLCLQAFGLAPKIGHPRGRQVGKYLCNSQQNMLFLIKSNSECLS